ncbi:type IV toxin-antitoxin system AbiEi family antitoxin domain-containing protein [Nocardioides stalactiti]|uniref:type IV toxin-antitoxin system AbiEi family antitoxin domain-containing protein n=1 Tax=Nocardioides stalactiti TaxID=2755356 RepID=UPI001603560C|nr:type IV toxin-antitoxin system AbiEi family antitoxin domain-containing protein [Nocardioides stalactiti]
MDLVAQRLVDQDGVIARRQALAAGLTSTDVARLVRRREWCAVHPGVYVTHNGPLPWQQRAWAAGLACWQAALDGTSALRACEGPGRRPRDDDVIAVVVAHERKVRAPDGVSVRRSRGFADEVQWNLSPPRARYCDVVIGLADRARHEQDAIAVLADACGGRRTTAHRLRAQVESTARLRRRAFLGAVLDDVASGTCSVLEHAFLTEVERPHGLPRGRRQVAGATGAGRRLFRDVVYSGRRPPWSQVVELDGRLFHDSAAARDRDMERDLDAALELNETVRLGYGQVLGRPCSTADKLGRLFQLRGWAGAPVRCPRCPSSGQIV